MASEIKWKGIPSVTTGGRRFFYRSEDGRSVVWNRYFQAYFVSVRGRSCGSFKSLRVAKAVAASVAVS